MKWFINLFKKHKKGSFSHFTDYQLQNNQTTA